MAAVATYNEALGPLRELIRAIETEWQAAWDARSERWQEGMVGQSVAEIITAWGTLADGLEDIQVELPEIEIPRGGLIGVTSAATCTASPIVATAAVEFGEPLGPLLRSPIPVPTTLQGRAAVHALAQDVLV